ncbi:MAG: phenylacetate--CoA ligase family protein [Pseudomonadota bacterium]
MSMVKRIGMQAVLMSRHRHRQGEFSVTEKQKLVNAAEKFSAQSVQDDQHQSLRNLLMYAYRNVPYYRGVIQSSGLVDQFGEIRLDRFHELPLLDKSAIREQQWRLWSEKLSGMDWHYNTSGGSTGEPIRIVQDREYNQWSAAMQRFFAGWSGYSTGQPRVLLWGSERDLFVGRENVKIHLLRWLSNELWLNTFRITPELMHSYVKKINEFKPVQILAYAESAYELAKFIEREGLVVHVPKSIMTSAGTLYSQMRSKIEQVFRAPVFNRYGSREVGDIASECVHHRGLHICPLTHYVEILRQDGMPALPGEVGEVVVTLLTNYSMPFVRYRIGDMAAWAEEHCTCGCSWPMLKEVAGRVSDTFLTREGTQIHGEYFTHLFYFRSWVEKFQVIQEDYDHVKVLLVALNKDANNSEYASDLEDISNKIRVVLGDACRIEYQFVDHIPPTASGKYRYTISKAVAA